MIENNDLNSDYDKIILSECPNETGPTITGNHKAEFYWDPDNPQTIASGESQPIKVIDTIGPGGRPPYTWSVSGDDFSLDQSTSTTNTLHAGPNACGSATITVTNRFGQQVTGSLRCTSSGRWVKQPYDTPWPYGPSPSGTIIGKYMLTGDTYTIHELGRNPDILGGCFSLEGCREHFDDNFSKYDGSYSESPYVLGCINVFGFTSSMANGSWPKYWGNCHHIVTPHCRGYVYGLVWKQAKYRVRIWECN